MRTAHPGAKMQLIDRHRLLEVVLSGALLHPVFVVPLILRQIANYGGRFGRNLGLETVWVGLLLVVPEKTRTDRVFVTGAFADVREEYFPDSTGAQAHGVAMRIPIVEIA